MGDELQVHLSKPGGQREGPYSVEQIQRDLAAKKYRDTDYWAWHTGLTAWVPLYELPELKNPAVAEQAAATVPPDAPQTPATRAGAAPAAPAPAAAAPIAAAAPAPSPKAVTKAKAPSRKAAAKADAPGPKAAAKAEAPSPKAGVRGEAPGPKAPAKTETPTPKPAVQAEAPSPKAGVRGEAPGPKAAAKAETPTPKPAVQAEAPSPKIPAKTEPPASKESEVPAAEEPVSLHRQLSSGMPFATLEQLFIFTTGPGPAIWDSQTTVEMCRAVIGEEVATIRSKTPRDVISECDVRDLLGREGGISESVWRAMSARQPELIQRARAGDHRICVRTFRIEDGVVVALVLFYDKRKAVDGQAG